MRRIANTWELAQQAARVLLADKELLALPVFAFLAWLIVVATFVVPGVLTGVLAAGGPGVGGWILLLAAYVASAYVTIFFNSALVLAADQRLRGGDPTVRSALMATRRHAARILPWAVVSATVSVILQLIERQGWVGDLVASVLGITWSLVTFLVIPVLVFEDVGVGAAVARSRELFARTWGENLSAQVGFGLLGLVFALPGLVLVPLGIATGSGALTAALLALAVLWVAMTAIVMSALSSVFQAALYRYAVRGPGRDGFFDERTLRASFAPR